MLSSYDSREENADEVGVKTLVTDFYHEKENAHGLRVVDNMYGIAVVVQVLLGRRRRPESLSGVVFFTGYQVPEDFRIGVQEHSI